MTYDYLIVGAGLFGATCARLLADAGKSVLVIDRRANVAGNCYDALVDGIPVGKFGGHIFHTNSPKIWSFINRFGTWISYEHRVKAKYKDRVYSMPPNLATFDQIGVAPGPEGERCIREMLFDGYSQKQWGKPLHEIPVSVLARVPIRYTYDDRYFTDEYQGVPKDGYTSIVLNMLRGIPVELGVDFLKDREYWRSKAGQVIYSGAIDALFGHDLGRLDYRSLTWRHQVIESPDYQGCATVNYTDADIPFTRILEWQHYGWRARKNGTTIISVEYPQAEGEPYYPIDDARNQELYQQYKQRLQDTPWLHVGGRLGSYRYYNMDQVIAQAMATVSEIGKGV